ncbi:MAG: hypothetical protein FJX75_04280 [Armatimonadetes bacterium]|nr:hypothetical protein [Armatimonadota bacterium]
MNRWDEVPLTRKGWLRMALWGAAGLSLLPASLLGCKRKVPPPTCYAPPPPDPKSVTLGMNAKPVEGDGVLARWAELGRIWRELSAHSRGKYEGKEGEKKLKALEAEMAKALTALPAWTELRRLFEERAAHVYREHYFLATCYRMAPWNPMQAQGDVEKQMTALQKLIEEGTLTKEAAEKAAQAVAADAEYLTQLRAMYDGGEAARAKFEPVHEAYQAGKLKPGEGAERAGRHVVELEVDKPGLLTDTEG